MEKLFPLSRVILSEKLAFLLRFPLNISVRADAYCARKEVKEIFAENEFPPASINSAMMPSEVQHFSLTQSSQSKGMRCFLVEGEWVNQLPVGSSVAVRATQPRNEDSIL